MVKEECVNRAAAGGGAPGPDGWGRVRIPQRRERPRGETSAHVIIPRKTAQITRTMA